jgi:hypothetical protein
MQNNSMNIIGTIGKIGKGGVAVAVIALVAFNSVELVGGSESVRIQNDITGKYSWYTTQGTKMKVPFFSTVETYNSVTTVAVTDDKALLESASATRPPLSVSFADNYGGQLEASWRARLPTSHELLERFHQDVKGQTNFEGNTLLTFSRDMLNLTTDQFLAQDFMQGGKGAFKQRLVDQAAGGMYVTRREKVEVQGSVADQSTSGGDRDQTKTTGQFIYKVVVQLDETGSPKRRPHSLTKYGIKITQTDLGEFVPNHDLEGYVTDIKDRERSRATIVANQQLERDTAVTEQLTGDRKRITAKNIELMQKDKEVIQGEKRVELAQIQAEQEIVEREKVASLSIIDKQREQSIAEANEGIQKANAEAAKYEARAIKEVGFAEAAVKKADYQAIDKTILALEVDKAKALAMYSSNMTINMPTIASMGSNGNGAGSIADMTSLKLLEQLGHPVSPTQVSVKR